MNRLIFSTVTLTVISMAAAEFCQAQCRRPGVILSIGASDGAHTYEGDVLRGRGALYQGQGAFLHGMGAYQIGAGQYLESAGRYQITHQQAQLIAEDVKVKKLETYERKQQSKRSQAESKAQAKAQAQHQKALAELSALRDRPTLATVRSGDAPNFLLAALGSQAASANWNGVVLTPEQLSQVRLQTATGLLPCDHAESPFDGQGQVGWPSVVSDREFEATRQQIETRLSQLLQPLQAGQAADKAAVATLRQEISQFASRVQRKHNLAKNVAAASQARLFLTSLSEAVKPLGSDSAVQAFDGTLDFQARDAVELVQYMTRHNLRFAPTDADGTVAYTKLHETLAATHRDLFGVNVANR